jgi:DNA-binding response OmpR family regulator
MKQILVVDDDPRIGRGLSVRLKFAGYEVRTAEDGVTGLKLALEIKPDLVILDIMMPVGGGYSVAYRLREQAPELPVIFITASKQPQLREMAAKLDAVGFFEKPYEFEELLAAVKAALKSESCWAATPEPSPEPKSIPSRIATTNPSSQGKEKTSGAVREYAPAPTTPEKALDLRPANLRLAVPAGYAQNNQPGLVGITGRNRILIVEDDRRISMALATRLVNAGQEVIQAFDAVSGVEKAIQHQPDLILMDIALPGGSGLMVAQRIQSVVPKPTPIIFLTASRQAGLRQKALALGAAGFLEKPYDPQELLTAIQNALLPAANQAPGNNKPAPTTPSTENALGLRLANLRMAVPSGSAPRSQPKLGRIIGRNKILIVEHDRRIAMDLTLPLQNAGQEVIQATDAMSGVAAATQHQPDLILMDINLPGDSGLIVAQSIQSVVPKLTPVIFLTAGKQPELRQKALAQGAAGFLEKPFDPEVLLTMIQNVLSLGRGDDPATDSGCPL